MKAPQSWWILTLGLLLKAVCVAAMIAAPAAGVWVASSLAAFMNRATWLPVLAGVLLFPALPLAWEAFSFWRAKQRGKARILTFFDRIVLRTLAINAVFLVVLLVAYPTRAFIALSARGDWMLDGRDGAAADRIRSGLSSAASTLEWLYRATRENPYDDVPVDDRKPTLEPKPTTAPTATTATTATTAPGSSSAPLPPPDARVPTAARAAYPWPETLHPLIANLPSEAETSIASLGKYIAEREPDPMLRVKALHDWVADRVEYNVPALREKRISRTDGDPVSVFQSRIGVCAGYARLLVELGKVTGDEILYVPGDSRSQTSPMEGESHAWNAARIGNDWYLLDATWDAGVAAGDRFEKRYRTAYLFTPPSQFAVTHYPDDEKWQLLDRPLSRVEFFQRPVLAPAFFAHGLELRAPDRAQVSVASSLELDVGNPRSVFLLASYTPKGGGEQTDCEGDGRTRLECRFPNAGTYDVRLFANAQEFGTYAYAASVQVNAAP